MHNFRCFTMIAGTGSGMKSSLGVLLMMGCIALQLDCESPAKKQTPSKQIADRKQGAPAEKLIPSEPIGDRKQGAPAEKRTPPEQVRNGKQYNFENRFAIHSIPLWESILIPFKGKPNVRFLEIGLGEGETTIWMLENILTHPSAGMVGIDVFAGELKARFFANLQTSGLGHKVKVFIEKSQVKLKSLPPNSFDIIYVDGSHAAPDVLTDAVLSWPLLRRDGLLIFDDYLMSIIEPGPDRQPDRATKRIEGGIAFLPLELTPRVAVDAFISAFRNDLEVIHKGYQLVLKKRDEGSDLSIGEYRYDWWKKELRRADDRAKVPLSIDEQKLIERLFLSRPFGEVAFRPDEGLLKDQRFADLTKRLNLVLGGKK